MPLPESWMFNDAGQQSGDMFHQPVAIPATNVDENPLYCLAVNEDYVSIVALALERLLYYDAWAGEAEEVARVTEQFGDVIGRFLQTPCIEGGCETPEEDEGCIEIGAFHPAIDYWPNHPILSPDAAPVGPYGATCWHTGAAYFQSNASEAQVNPLCYTASLIDFLSYGAPSVTIRFSGTGEIDIHFLSQPQGGWAWVFPDGNPLLGEVIDLSFANLLDLASLEFLLTFLGLATGAEDIEVIHTMEFDTPGDHTITAWFLPSAGVEPPFIGAGGGLRKVQFCGDIQIAEETVVAYTLVQNGCEVQLQADGVPVSTISVQTPEPACDFEDTVTIGREATTEYPFLVLRGESAKTTNNGPAIRFTDLTDIAAQIAGVWATPAQAEGGLNFSVARANSLANSLQMRTDPILFHFRKTGIADGPILAQWSADNNTVIHQAVASGVARWILRGEGRTEHYQRVPSQTSGQDVAWFSARADGVTPGANFGAGIALLGDSSTTQNQYFGRITGRWLNAAHAARSAEIAINAYDWSGASNVLRAAAADGDSLLGVHGKAAQAQPVITGDDTNQALASLLAALDAVGYISNQATVGSPQLLTDALGDLDRPPDSVLNACEAANYLVFWLNYTVNEAFTEHTGTIPELYAYFLAQHGWVIDNLWNFCVLIDTYYANASAIINDVSIAMGNLVRKLAEDPYDRVTFSAYVDGYIFAEGETGDILLALCQALTVPTWNSKLFYGSVAYPAVFSCDCIGGAPVVGDYAVEWFSPGADWFNGACGDGWDVEYNCPVGDSTLNTRFTCPGVHTTQYELVRAEITVEFDCASTEYFSCSMTGPVGSFTFPGPQPFNGTGTHTFVSSAGGILFYEEDTLNVNVFNSSLIGGSDYVRITNIRVEGTGTVFPSEGSEC